MLYSSTYYVGFKIRLYDTNWTQVLGQSGSYPVPIALESPPVVLKEFSSPVTQQARAIGPLPASRRTQESPVALESASLYCDVYIMAFSEMMVTEGLPSPELLPSSR